MNLITPEKLAAATNTPTRAARRALVAKFGPGPTSNAGKAVVRLNAVRHGLLSRAPVMAGESADEYAALCSQLKAELSPVGILETQLCERMAGALWRLRRLSHIEAGILTGSAANVFADAADAQAETFSHTDEAWDGSFCGKTTILDEAAHAEATDAAKQTRAFALSDASALVGAAYKNEAPTLDERGAL
jgi:hypothetical protein